MYQPNSKKWIDSTCILCKVYAFWYHIGARMHGNKVLHKPS